MKTALASLVIALVSFAAHARTQAQTQARADTNNVVCRCLVYDSVKGLIWPASGSGEQVFPIPGPDRLPSEFVVSTPTGVEFDVQISNVRGLGPAVSGRSGPRLGMTKAEAGVSGYKSVYGLDKIALAPRLTVSNGSQTLMAEMTCFFK